MLRQKEVQFQAAEMYFDEESSLLGVRDALLYRAIVARANYLAQDRFDIAYAVKELSRGMSSPTYADWNQLKKLGRYLTKHPRATMLFGYQGCVDTVTPTGPGAGAPGNPHLVVTSV